MLPKLTYRDLVKVAGQPLPHVLLWRNSNHLRDAWWRRWRKPVGLAMWLREVGPDSVLLEPMWLSFSKAAAAQRRYSFQDIGLGQYSEYHPFSKYFLSRCVCPRGQGSL